MNKTHTTNDPPVLMNGCVIMLSPTNYIMIQTQHNSVINNYHFSEYNLVISYFNFDESHAKKHMRRFYIEFGDIECRGYSYYEVGRCKINIERDERAADSSYEDLQKF